VGYFEHISARDKARGCVVIDIKIQLRVGVQEKQRCFKSSTHPQMMVAGPPPIRGVAIGAASPKAGGNFRMTSNIGLLDIRSHTNGNDS